MPRLRRHSATTRGRNAPSACHRAPNGCRRSGLGKVYTFTQTNQNGAPGFREALPYIMAYVELDEGVKMLTNLVDCRAEDVKIGMPVEVVYEDVTPEVTLAKFRPAR